MRTEKQILELRASVHTQMQALLKTAADEKRALTAEEDQIWERMDNEFKAFTTELDKVRKMQSIEADMNRQDDDTPPVIPQLPGDQAAKKMQFENYFRQLFTGEGMPMQDAMRLAYQEVSRTQTSTTEGNGAYIVPEEFIRQLEITMKAFGGMMQASFQHTSRRGGTMNWPTNDSTTRTGQWVDEPRASGITPQAFTFSRKQFAAYTWTDMAQLTWEFIQDEDVSFVATVLAQLFGESAGRALNYAYTLGDGSGKPTGILDATSGASTGKTTSSNSAFTKAELIDAIHSVDPAYRNGPNVAWMFNDDTLARIRKLDFGTTDTVPIWQPSFREGDPDRVLGYRYVINQDFPSLAAGAKIAAFGDWNKYIIRNVQTFQMVRLNERFADQLSTGFLGWLRTDGKLLQSAAIKLLRMNT
jgi:HK97 family phage major capsid protein